MLHMFAQDHTNSFAMLCHALLCFALSWIVPPTLVGFMNTRLSLLTERRRLVSFRDLENSQAEYEEVQTDQ